MMTKVYHFWMEYTFKILRKKTFDAVLHINISILCQMLMLRSSPPKGRGT